VSVITQADFDAMQRRVAPKESPQSLGIAIERESELHERIAADLKLRRYYFVHSRTDRATTTALGVPDFIVATPAGVTVWIEVKRPGAKLRPEQNAVRHFLTNLGHRYAVVHSFKEYEDVFK
jgi:hypothetical protein